MNVKLIRVWSGEDIVADLVSESEDSITVINPIVAVPSGSGTMGFAPWSPILKERGTEITIPKTYVVYLTETQDGIVDQYKEMFGVIKTPDKKKLIL
tara:strand:- start:853 stop:1143 length:291 start_codon:yes stop_codon:yes gene_type:complete